MNYTHTGTSGSWPKNRLCNSKNVLGSNKRRNWSVLGGPRRGLKDSDSEKVLGSSQRKNPPVLRSHRRRLKDSDSENVLGSSQRTNWSVFWRSWAKIKGHRLRTLCQHTYSYMWCQLVYKIWRLKDSNSENVHSLSQTNENLLIGQEPDVPVCV
jgi:hypothetical protein